VIEPVVQAFELGLALITPSRFNTIGTPSVDNSWTPGK
jgi:hypothetical protein